MGRWAQQRRRGSDPLGISRYSMGPLDSDWFLQAPPNGIFADLTGAAFPPGIGAWQIRWAYAESEWGEPLTPTDAPSVVVLSAEDATTYWVQARWFSDEFEGGPSPWSPTKVYYEP